VQKIGSLAPKFFKRNFIPAAADNFALGQSFYESMTKSIKRNGSSLSLKTPYLHQHRYRFQNFFLTF
jgi:hypothetical protein